MKIGVIAVFKSCIFWLERSAKTHCQGGTTIDQLQAEDRELAIFLLRDLFFVPDHEKKSMQGTN